MKQPSPSDALRYFLIASLGLSFFACGRDSRSLSDDEPSDRLDENAAVGGNDDVLASGGEEINVVSVSPGKCTQPKPFLEGVETGLERCREGYVHRAKQVECPSQLPRDRIVIPGAGGYGGDSFFEFVECLRDSDCDSGEYCQHSPDEFETYSYCRPACESDADCDGGVCICGEEFGTCSSSLTEARDGCTVDGDCESDELCVGVDKSGSNCGASYQFVCAPFPLECGGPGCGFSCEQEGPVVDCRDYGSVCD